MSLICGYRRRQHTMLAYEGPDVRYAARVGRRVVVRWAMYGSSGGLPSMLLYAVEGGLEVWIVVGAPKS